MTYQQQGPQPPPCRFQPLQAGMPLFSLSFSTLPPCRTNEAIMAGPPAKLTREPVTLTSSPGATWKPWLSIYHDGPRCTGTVWSPVLTNSCIPDPSRSSAWRRSSWPPFPGWSQPCWGCTFHHTDCYVPNPTFHRGGLPDPSWDLGRDRAELSPAAVAGKIVVVAALLAGLALGWLPERVGLSQQQRLSSKFCGLYWLSFSGPPVERPTLIFSV